MIPEYWRGVSGADHPTWKDGRSSHPLYKTWKGMLDRCNNPRARPYPHYGGRGITVCDRWEDFWVFVLDVGDRPDGTSLDRIDNDGPYEPANVRWATRREQRLNSRKNLATECPKGHPYSEENSYTNSAGYRECLICKREKSAKYMRERRARESS